jgi:transposase
VLVGIETDRGPWVTALIAAGYTVYAINPLQVARYRERHGVSGAKSDAADAHTLADMVRTDSHQLRPVAADSAQAQAVKVVTRAHKTLIWERTRHTQRLRHALREYFPAAVEAFEDLDAADVLELLARAPDPASAAKLTIAQISAALTRARRRNVSEKAARIQAVLRAEYLSQPAVITAAYAATTRAAVAVLKTLNEQVTALQGQPGPGEGARRAPSAMVIAGRWPEVRMRLVHAADAEERECLARAGGLCSGVRSRRWTGPSGGRPDGLPACAGVLVADTGGVLVPGRFVERSASPETGFSNLIAAEPLKAGQIPQPRGLVVAGGGQGAPVGGERHPVHLVGVAG